VSIISLLNVAVSDSSRQYSPSAIATLIQANRRSLTSCQRLRPLTQSRGITATRRDHFLTWSTWCDFQHGGFKHHTSKSKGKQLAINSGEFDIELSSSLKEILIEPEEIYQHTQIPTGAIAPVDYNTLARGIEASDEHSTIAESQSSNSYIEKEDFAFMVRIPKDMGKRFKSKLGCRRSSRRCFKSSKSLSTTSKR